MSPSSPVSVKAGSSVSVECVAEGKPTPDVQWETQLKSHSSLQLGERGRGVSKLVIETVGPEDEGNYTCQAQNIVGKTQETVQLIGKFVVRPLVIQVIVEVCKLPCQLRPGYNKRASDSKWHCPLEDKKIKVAWSLIQAL